jgi:hypothetical protein
LLFSGMPRLMFPQAERGLLATIACPPQIKNLRQAPTSKERMIDDAMPSNAKASSGKSVVLTVGHSTREWKDFLDLLRAHGVRRVVDVRTIPRSRHNPQYNRETLPAKLRAAGISYVHMSKLGGLRRASPDSPNKGWRNASFRGYADYMQTTDFAAGFQRLMKLAQEKRTAIMCAEAVPWRCHRSLIADALLIRGIQVEDIMSLAPPRIHTLAPFACVRNDRVRGKRITYPAANDECAVPVVRRKSRDKLVKKSGSKSRGKSPSGA